MNSGFRACEDRRKNSQDDEATMPVRGWRRALPRFGVSLVTALRPRVASFFFPERATAVLLGVATELLVAITFTLAALRDPGNLPS